RKRRMNTDTGIVDQKIEITAAPLCLQGVFDAGDKSVESFAAGHIERNGDSFSAHCLDLLYDLFGFGLFAVISKDYVIPFGGDVQGHAFAEAAASTGNECDFHGFLLTCTVNER